MTLILQIITDRKNLCKSAQSVLSAFHFFANNHPRVCFNLNHGCFMCLKFISRKVAKSPRAFNHTRMCFKINHGCSSVYNLIK